MSNFKLQYPHLKQHPGQSGPSGRRSFEYEPNIQTFSVLKNKSKKNVFKESFVTSWQFCLMFISPFHALKIKRKSSDLKSRIIIAPKPQNSTIYL